VEPIKDLDGQHLKPDKVPVEFADGGETAFTRRGPRTGGVPGPAMTCGSSWS